MIALALQNGLAKNVKEALLLTPYQVIAFLDLKPKGPRVGTPEEFLLMLGASQ